MEWNRKLILGLASQYSSLAIRDESHYFSRHQLANDLASTSLLIVDIHSQTLALYINNHYRHSYQISTSLYGAGCRLDTGCTPLGWHRLKRKIGHNAVVGSVFVGRQVQWVADNLSSNSDDDLITSRILWLDGIQPGINQGGSVDSFKRYIYIHGTAQEHLIGQAVSHGCIRMRNAEVVSLFDLVQENSIVLISHHLTSMLDAVGAE